ncbi:UNVERIFIED_CONTAM: hypothetical protein Slati_2645200 [Sesamum latifolium]|uniref:Integrase zinc-binding domain-containing protein n=1 Tax=Sesamum latifolium TaxID=2727402 RepID=A0AAW2VW17_9LAMI
MQGMVPWYSVIVNYLVARALPPDLSRTQIDKVKSEAKYYVWDDPYLWRFCADQVVRRCAPNDEHNSVLNFCHNFACGGHFGPKRTARKIWSSTGSSVNKGVISAIEQWEPYSRSMASIIGWQQPITLRQMAKLKCQIGK